VAGKGKPVVTVLLSGRPLWVNDLMNLSDTFIAAWLPGTEGKGVSDLLVAAKGARAYDFTGKLSFSWPKSVCQSPLNAGDANYAPLFAYGYGLKKGARSHIGQLDASYPAGGCASSNTYPLFGQSDRASFPLQLRSGDAVKPLGADLNATVSLPGISVTTAQINTQQDAKLVTWTGPASFEAHGAKALVLPPAASSNAALRFDAIVQSAPAGKVTIAMGGTAVDATRLFQRLAGKGKQVVKIPLACFTARGADLAKVDTPFSVSSSGAFAAAFGNIDAVGGAAGDQDALRCEDLQ
jgi:beta-glucosidase